MKVLILAIVCAPHLLWAWSVVRNGGGGVFENGQYMTFYSANIPVQASPLSISEVPGLQMLVQKLEAMPLNPQVKSQLLTLVYPVGSARGYYKIAEDQLSADLRQQIMDQYAKLVNLPSQELILFAMTNNSAQTFLLPEFYQLTEAQQAVILFHEGLWDLQADLPYSDVVSAEIAFQAYLENPHSGDAFFNFFDTLTTVFSYKQPHPELTLQASFYFDHLQAKPTAGISLQSLVGKKFLSCVQSTAGNDSQGLASCSAQLQDDLMAEGPTQTALFPRALLAALSHDTSVFLCLRQNLSMEADDDLFDANFQAWVKLAAVEPVLWQKNDFQFQQRPDSGVNEFLKVDDGKNHFWGTLGLCKKLSASN